MPETTLQALIQQYTAPLAPIPTDVRAAPRRLKGVKAVLFDIYGTLLVSDSGDIGAQRRQQRVAALGETLDACGLHGADADAMLNQLDGEIISTHERLKSEGIDYPEVDIVDIWKSTLAKRPSAQQLAEWQTNDWPIDDWQTHDWQRFAITFELLANPVWPMPDAAAVLRAVSSYPVAMGVVSNAQFYTPIVMEHLLQQSLEGLGFNERLLFYSYRHQCAKPSPELFRYAIDQLNERGIGAHEAVFVGNDMLNDVTAAAAAGFQTVLFAGDKRSLRWRDDDSRVSGINPDAVITSLRQLAFCLDLTDSQQP